ncbi:MAG: AraC family transcriptional regulator [Pseudoxanthomonas sp.]
MLTSCKNGLPQVVPHLSAAALARCDLVALNRLFRIFRMETLQLDSVTPKAFIGSMRQGGSIACSTEYGFSVQVRFSMPPDQFLLGYIHHAGENSWCQAVPLESGTAFSVMPDRDADFKFGASTRITHVLLPTCAQYGSMAKPGMSKVDPHYFIKLFQSSGSTVFARLERTYQQIRWKVILQSDAMYEDLTEPVDFQNLIESHAAASLCASSENILSCPRSRRRHYLTVQRTEQFIRANLSRDIYVTEMCNAAEVSERALRYAFDDLFGISPIRYLAMLRLCVASRKLSDADGSRRSVKSIAMNCGLRDLSRFADNYRRAFGELPHDTLLRSPSNDENFPEN